MNFGYKMKKIYIIESQIFEEINIIYFKLNSKKITSGFEMMSKIN